MPDFLFVLFCWVLVLCSWITFWALLSGAGRIRSWLGLLSADRATTWHLGQVSLRNYAAKHDALTR